MLLNRVSRCQKTAREADQPWDSLSPGELMVAFTPSCSPGFCAGNQAKNMATRIYTTVCFWHPCAKTPHMLSFFQWTISTSDDEKFQEPFFHLACGRHVSLRHVVAIDPLIDSIPESSIDGWASAVLRLTGAIFWGGSNNDQSVGFLQLSSFLALAPSKSIHYACGPPTSQRSKRARTLHQRSTA